MSWLGRGSILFGVLLVLGACWLLPVDGRATQEVEQGMARALASFAVARGLNAAISVAQGTEVALQPAGVGVVLAPGQLLDPLNDLIEQFSSLMLLAAAVFGVQRVLIEIGAHSYVQIALSVAALAWSAAALLRNRAAPLLGRALLLLLLVRFAVPVVALGSHQVYLGFMAEKTAAAQQAMDRSAAEAAASPGASGELECTDEGWLCELRRWAANATSAQQALPDIDSLKAHVDRLIDHIVELMVAFLLQTLVLPLLFLWVMVRAGRALLEGGSP